MIKYGGIFRRFHVVNKPRCFGQMSNTDRTNTQHKVMRLYTSKKRFSAALGHFPNWEIPAIFLNLKIRKLL